MWSNAVLGVTIVLYLCGCDALRFAPGEAMKANAYVHHRTTQLAADTARQEQVSAPLQQLTALSQEQSRAFVADYGLPRELPSTATVEEILDTSTHDLASAAVAQAQRRPNPWETADAFLEVGIGIAGVLGGAYGLRIGQILQKARQKSKALQEVIEGNERFKEQYHDMAEAFKDAHAHQSTQTRQLVAELK
ncbi:MAG: hypothetical protein JW828_00285 [Sedimentisphaerales bacterium]|nr:hypothetical protein [Sedimentisphaerales bacterium]